MRKNGMNVLNVVIVLLFLCIFALVIERYNS